MAKLTPDDVDSNSRSVMKPDNHSHACFCRRRISVYSLLALLAAVVVLRSSIQHWFEWRAFLNSETLDATAFHEFVSNSAGKFELLRKAWLCGKIPQREAVMQMLAEITPEELASDENEKLLLQAAQDGDATIRVMAMSTLARLKHPTFVTLLTKQTLEADPDLRLMAVEHLRSQPPEIAVPLLGSALGDQSPLVAASAASALQRLTGQDFGVRVAPILDSNVGAEDREKSATNLESTRHWWASHKSAYSIQPLAEIPQAAPAFAVSDFTLKDLKGAAVRLSDFRGKMVLLNFWTTWCTACQAEFPVLSELQKRHASDLVILGVSLDGVADEHGHVPGHDDASDSQPNANEIRNAVARTAAARSLQYTILLDPENSVGGRFNGGELPTNVLIDADGRFWRRFIGARKIEDLEAMLAELKSSPSLR